MGRMVGERRFTSPVPAVGRWLKVGITPIFFVSVRDFEMFKKLQIADICVYLRKNWRL